MQASLWPAVCWYAWPGAAALRRSRKRRSRFPRKPTTTGYSWTSAIEGSTLALYTEKSISAEEAYPTEDANRVGAEGSHLFSFKGMAAGDGTIALSYERSWEQTDDDKKIVLQVKTGQNGAIESVSVG